jgi:protease I
MKPVLMIIAPVNFRDEELFDTREEIEKAGLTTVIASAHKGECQGAGGKTAIAAISLEEVNSADYEAVVFVGGFGTQVYFENETAIQIAKNFADQGKFTSAICIAPVILGKAGLLTNKKATVYETEAGTLQALGANYTGSTVTKDGFFITGNGPASSREFGQTIAKALTT